MRVRVMVGLMVCMVAPAVAMPPPEERGSDLPAPSMDLEAVWRAALLNDAGLKREEARRDAALETRVQARGQLLPQVGLQAYREDLRSDGDRIGLTGTGIGLVTTRTDTDTDFIGLQLRQPIIAVDRWIGLQQAGDIRDAAELQLDFARENLMLRVAQAYFTALATEDRLRVAQTHLASVRRFREQIGHRYDAGVVANTDLQEAQAALDNAEADAIDARHAVSLARQDLVDLVGAEPGRLQPVSAALNPIMPEPNDRSWWLMRARTDATPVRLAGIGQSVAQREIQRRRAASYPTLDFVASRSRLDRSSNNPFEMLDVDGTTLRLEMNVPLFAGGAIQSRVRQAAAEHREASYRLDEARLLTVSEAQRAWFRIESSVQRVQAREQALRSTTIARRAAESGLVEGVRTTLDVLDSQRLQSGAEAALAMARYEYVLAVFALRAATGLLDERALLQVNAWLDQSRSTP